MREIAQNLKILIININYNYLIVIFQLNYLIIIFQYLLHNNYVVYT